jgi:thiosulfate reductase cytochrome b subunit/hemin uptake protein HemP
VPGLEPDAERERGNENARESDNARERDNARDLRLPGKLRDDRRAWSSVSVPPPAKAEGARVGADADVRGAVPAGDPLRSSRPLLGPDQASAADADADVRGAVPAGDPLRSSRPLLGPDQASAADADADVRGAVPAGDPLRSSRPLLGPDQASAADADADVRGAVPAGDPLRSSRPLLGPDHASAADADAATATATATAPATGPDPLPSYPILVRLSHWVNAVALIMLVMSGLEIFNAHPTLYLADASDMEAPHLTLPDFPGWMTLGGWLAGARRLHFALALVFIANGILYVAYMRASRRRFAVWPIEKDWRALGPAIRDHLTFPPKLHGEGGALNPLQKVSYLGVSLLLAPFVVLSGLALSPQWDAVFPWYTDLFGGRQFARSWHFAATAGFVGFLGVHVLMVALSGWGTFVHMLTGRRDAR